METDNMRETDETEREAIHGKAVYGSSVTSLAGEKKVRAMRVLKAAVCKWWWWWWWWRWGFWWVRF
jgi:hypothetical protein